MARRGFFTAGIFVAGWLASLALGAELPVARLDTIFPPGGQKGTEVEAALTSADLDGAQALHFSHPGISATPKGKQFAIKIGPEVPAGLYDVRVAGLLGLSNPRVFAVGDLPESIKSAGNSSAESAQELAVDATVSGTAAAGQADWFKFQARAGQRLIIHCAAPELDSKLTPVLAVRGAGGDELAVSRSGGMLDFTPQKDGAYFLELHDVAFAGSADHFYRLTVTTGPWIDFAFPPCGKPGASSRFTLYGRNLPGGAAAGFSGQDGQPLERLEQTISVPSAAETQADGLTRPACAAVDGFSYRLREPHASNAAFIGYSDLPIVGELTPGAPPEAPRKLTPPCEAVGQFRPGGATETFAFDAHKGEVWSIEVISARLGLPTNPFLLVQREGSDPQEAYASENDVGGVRFSTASNDPALRVDVREDGTYRVQLRDLFGGSRRDPRKLYRLVIRKEAPDFHLIALAEAPPEKKDDRNGAPRCTLLRAEGTAAIKVLVLRRDGFAAEIGLHAEGLPPGVQCSPTKIPAGANEGLLLLTSEGKPAPWSGAIRVFGAARIGDAEVRREARGGAVRWTVADGNVEAIQPRLTRDIGLAVSAAESAPITVAAKEAGAREVPTSGKLEVPLQIARRGEFKEALKLKAAGEAGLDALKETEIPANATEATATLDLAAAKLAPGPHTLYFTAQTKGKFRGKDVTTTIYSSPVAIVVQPIPPK